jgi:hypothetical protein
MRSIVEQYNPEVNFWEINSQYTVINPFRKIWSSDKTRGKKSTSDLMWAICLIYHPKSDLYYVPDKEVRISMDLLKVKKSDIDSFWEENKQYVDAFLDTVLTQGERSLISWETRMKQRDTFLSEQHYHFGYVDEEGNEYKDNTKALDDMNSKTGKFYEEFFKIKKDIEEEEVKDNKGRKGYSSSDINI